jgi:hypothetical protein
MTNYPPGVTGREYEIAGPDWEKDEDETCEACGVVATIHTEGYHGFVWSRCAHCGDERDLSPYVEDEE